MSGLEVAYPLPDQITDPSVALPPSIKTAVERHIEDAEVAYRGFLLRKSQANTKPLEILVGCALKVFAEVANAARDSYPNDFAAFQTAISFHEGAGRVGVMAAHYAYKRAARGRMSFLDQAEIEKRLQQRIEEVEYQWKLRRRATTRPRKQKGQSSKILESASRKRPPVAHQGTMADIIEKHKLKQGLTDEQLAEQMDISRDTLYKLKRGESVSHEVRFKAADVLWVGTRRFAFAVTPPSPPQELNSYKTPTHLLRQSSYTSSTVFRRCVAFNHRAMQRTTKPKDVRKNRANEPFCKNEYFVAQFFGVSVGTVRRWRHQSRGPRFLRIGGLVRYRLEDLQAWLDSRPIGGEVPRGAEQ